MSELLFFGGAALVIGLSYFMGFRSGLDKNLKEEVRMWIKEMTVHKMAHDHFMEQSKIETRKFLAMLGAKQPKDFKVPKVPSIDDFDKHN